MFLRMKCCSSWDCRDLPELLLSLSSRGAAQAVHPQAARNTLSLAQFAESWGKLGHPEGSRSCSGGLGHPEPAPVPGVGTELTPPQLLWLCSGDTALMPSLVTAHLFLLRASCRAFLQLMGLGLQVRP